MQRAFIPADGVAENEFLLGAIMRQSEHERQPLAIASVDAAKAFYNVSHESIDRAAALAMTPPIVDVIRGKYDRRFCRLNSVWLPVSCRTNTPYPTHLNPRPGGGLSHLRHGGGGAKMTPPLTQKLGKLEGRAIRRSTALTEPVRSHFGHFFAQVNIEVSRGHQRSNFRKMMVLSGMPAIISGTIIATPNPKKAQDSS